MAKKTIELGTAPDGMDGDDARTAFQKTNDNFTELYQGVGGAQPASPKLSAIASSVWAANQLLIATGADTIGGLLSGTTGRALIAAANVTEGRSALALGTAATGTVTTSWADTTANRITKVGDYAWGATTLPDSDLATISHSTGFRGFNSAALPTLTTHVGVHLQRETGGRALTVVGGDSGNRLWWTNRTSAGAAQPWKEALAKGDYGLGGMAVQLFSAAEANALTPNDQGNYFFAGAISGALGIPKSYGGQMSHFGRGGDTAVQRFVSTGTNDVTICYRTYNTAASGHSPWVRVMTTLDLIANSGDTTAGRMLTVGYMGLGARVGFNASNANAATYTGFYQGAGAGSTNYMAGTSTAYGPMIVMGRDNAVLTQLASFASTSVEPELCMRGSGDTGATWSNWRKFYHNGNVVGTVSQTGGVPTGAILEYGSNAAGNYTRFADGRIICQVTTPFFQCIANGPTDQGITFPSAIVTSSPISISGHLLPQTTFDVFGLVGATVSTSTSATIRVRNGATAQNIQAHLTIVGRWF